MTTPSNPAGPFDILNSDLERHIARAHQLRSEYMRRSATRAAAAIGRAFASLIGSVRRTGGAIPPRADAGTAA